MIRRYFEEEMRYLHEAGKAFAEANPDVARYLNIDSVSDRDPYVERLFEGFALLAGRIHEQLDDGLPEYTEGLFSLLYPHFLRPIPALCVVELNPKPGLVQETTVLAKGTELRSVPVGEEQAVCRFTTTRDVTLRPIRLSDAQVRYGSGTESSIVLRFELERGVDWERLAPSPLRLYFHADASRAAAMHLACTRHVHRVTVSAEGGEPLVLRGQQWVRPGGFGADEGVVPYGLRSPAGYRLVQEYLCFRSKFWSVDLLGLQHFRPGTEITAFSVEIALDRPFPEDHRFTAENVRLHCTPAVNLFSMDAEPIRVEGLDAEYRIVPSVRLRKSIETYDVEEVVGLETTTGRRHTYLPYFDFEREQRGGRRFTTRRRVGPANRPDVFLTLTGSSADAPAGFPAETLSVRIRATNGSLPRERLREGMINQLAPEVPRIVEPTNLQAPTMILNPPGLEDPEFLWKLLSHLSLNYMSLASREALLGLLRLYDWSATDANRRRLAGIQDVRWEPEEIVRRGALYRGARVTVTVQDGHFVDEGDLCLFGQVLSELLALMASINAFVHLTIELTPSGKSYEWKTERGQTPVL